MIEADKVAMLVTLRGIMKEFNLSCGTLSPALSDDTPARVQNRRKRTQRDNSSHWFMHGFTLIELLVVIAIIALLVSILLPSLNKAKSLAKTVICQMGMKHAGLGFALYTNDNDGTMPIQIPEGPMGSGGLEYRQANHSPDSWTYKLQPYLDIKKWDEATLLICPVTELSSTPPNTSPSSMIMTSYLYNWWMSKEDSPVTIDSVKQSSEIICLLDHSEAQLYCWTSYWNEILYAPSYYPHPEPRKPEKDGAFRNLLYVDGHSDTVGSYTTTLDQMTNYGEWK